MVRCVKKRQTDNWSLNLTEQIWQKYTRDFQRTIVNKSGAWEVIDTEELLLQMLGLRITMTHRTYQKRTFYSLEMAYISSFRADILQINSLWQSCLRVAFGIFWKLSFIFINKDTAFESKF